MRQTYSYPISDLFSFFANTFIVSLSVSSRVSRRLPLVPERSPRLPSRPERNRCSSSQFCAGVG